MNSRALEVTVISAEDLRINGKPIKKNALATIRIDSNNYSSTRVDSEGGSYPCWNHKMGLALPHHIRFIGVEVQCRTGSRVVSVGACKVPVSDFDADYVPSHYLHFLSYRLRERGGERNGIINLSVRVLVPERIRRVLPTLMSDEGAFRKDREIKANSSKLSETVKATEIVLGVPISMSYRVK